MKSELVFSHEGTDAIKYRQVYSFVLDNCLEKIASIATGETNETITELGLNCADLDNVALNILFEAINNSPVKKTLEALSLFGAYKIVAPQLSDYPSLKQLYLSSSSLTLASLIVLHAENKILGHIFESTYLNAKIVRVPNEGDKVWIGYDLNDSDAAIVNAGILNHKILKDHFEQILQDKGCHGQVQDLHKVAIKSMNHFKNIFSNSFYGGEDNSNYIILKDFEQNHLEQILESNKGEVIRARV